MPRLTCISAYHLSLLPPATCPSDISPMTSLPTFWLQTLWLDFLCHGICEFLTQKFPCSSERGEVIASSTAVLAWGWLLAEDNPASLCNVFTQAPESDQARPCIEKVASDQTKPIMLSFQWVGWNKAKDWYVSPRYIAVWFWFSFPPLYESRTPLKSMPFPLYQMCPTFILFCGSPAH